MSLPLAENLKLQIHDVEISYLVKENIVGIFRCIPYVDKVYVYKNKFSLLKFIKDFRKYDCVIFAAESKLYRLKFFSYLKVKKRIGFNMSEKFNNQLTDIVVCDEQFKSMERLFLNLLTPLNIRIKDDKIVPKLYPLNENIRKIESMLPKELKKIVIHADTFSLSRKWPYFNELSKAIMEYFKNKLYIILTGQKKDNPDIFSHIDLRGRTTLEELVAIFKIADLVVGCDTGALHIARATGTKTMVIYGPEDPKITNPSENLIKISPNRELECKNSNDYFGIFFKNIRRCKIRECSTIECLRSISSQEILKKIEYLFKNENLIHHN
ncbi:ADP-heptose--lipooligosaccharide heptosyltransferase II [Thermodesulfovibrio sp. N1]|nr:ADP-heptose--lipooligosaccharide heptosyltransferase II [Thermodesulfovibrio sp. N1]